MLMHAYYSQSYAGMINVSNNRHQKIAANPSKQPWTVEG